jgi:hypothetical protein
MAESQDDARGMDFWAALGIGEDSSDPQDAEKPQGKSKTGKKATSAKKNTPGKEPPKGPSARLERAAPDSDAKQREERDEWAAMFGGWNAPSASEAAPPTQESPGRAEPEQESDLPATPAKTSFGPEGSRSTPNSQAPQAAPKKSTTAPTAPSARTRPGKPPQKPPTSPRPAIAPPVRSRPHFHEETPAHITYESRTPARAPQTIQRTDSGSPANEGSAEYWPDPPGSPQHPRLAPEHAPAPWQGTVLSRSAPSAGWREFIELWRDDRVNEVHIRGTEVTVSGTLGVYSMPEFSSLGAARQAVEAIIATRAETGAEIIRIGESIVVTRRHRLCTDPASLVAAGIISEEQVSQVRMALEHTQAVTLTGPAAPVLMRSLASLVPAGSRVFEGPYAVLPAGCVTVASPLDADYVIGVRPGQIGALIANPETQFKAPVQFAVSGRSTAPGKVSAR